VLDVVATEDGYLVGAEDRALPGELAAELAAMRRIPT
jgi:hypothetical protein